MYPSVTTYMGFNDSEFKLQYIETFFNIFFHFFAFLQNAAFFHFEAHVWFAQSKTMKYSYHLPRNSMNDRHCHLLLTKITTFPL